MARESLTDKLTKVLSREKEFVPSSDESRLDLTLLEKFERKGLIRKSEYTLPMNDTLGQNFHRDTKYLHRKSLNSF